MIGGEVPFRKDARVVGRRSPSCDLESLRSTARGRSIFAAVSESLARSWLRVRGAPEHDAINVTRPHVAPSRALDYISPECLCRAPRQWIPRPRPPSREREREGGDWIYLAIIPPVSKGYARTVRRFECIDADRDRPRLRHGDGTDSLRLFTRGRARACTT